MRPVSQANFRYDHPSGTILGRISEAGVSHLLLPRRRRMGEQVIEAPPDRALAKALRRALERYFRGKREDFADIPLDLSDGTAFRRRVWLGARKIPWGRTYSYGELAQRIRSPDAARAVGQALGANPVPIIVPCHRILAADGSLGGFGAGLPWKRELLGIEGWAPG